MPLRREPENEGTIGRTRPCHIAASTMIASHVTAAIAAKANQILAASLMAESIERIGDFPSTRTSLLHVDAAAKYAMTA
jgi:hypothetical protein